MVERCRPIGMGALLVRIQYPALSALIRVEPAQCWRPVCILSPPTPATCAGEVWGTEGNRVQPKKEAKEVEPNFGLSGALAEETNKVNGVVLVYSEPPEASNPTLRWRLYIFKGGQLPNPCLPPSRLSHLLGD